MRAVWYVTAIFALAGIFLHGEFGTTPLYEETVLEPDKDKVWFRGQFYDAVIGKNADQVLKAVGPPSARREWGKRDHWYYDAVTRNIGADKLDTNVQVIFENGTVSVVQF